MRLNGSSTKNWEEVKVKLSEGLTLSDLLKTACKKFGHKENYKIAKLYNKNGLQLLKDDIELLSDGDVVYLAMKGIYWIY